MHRLAAERGGEAAAEVFLRTVITDAAYERMPERIRRRALATWPQIRDDATALAGYRVRYARLRDVRVPFLLLGGQRSPPMYAPTLEALAASLPRAELRTLRGAGHMMHADAYRQFGAAIAAFCDDIGYARARDR